MRLAIFASAQLIAHAMGYHFSPLAWLGTSMVTVYLLWQDAAEYAREERRR
ncbi:MAG TPA: hypothetical protein VN680_06315 [Burkholderiaceae bacterium]|nr:hypothetical protein [Burkholderiaceae bacterium]